MRFSRQARAELFEWTQRKLTLATKRPARQAQKLASDYPLIAEVLDTPPSFDLARETEQRCRRRLQSEQRMRALHARVWRESRRDYFGATEEQRALIRAAWRDWTGPTTSLYFRYVVDLHTGVIEARSERCRSEERLRRLKIWEARSAQQEILLD
ncbi:hypothetical protein [Acidovorax sp.]|uniref:hypothetical protein n=1 Tax=Acidovorax sp. TaxID=1872122 RepID=UPI0027B90E0D|nr:hypothetical protein [Acidovorax sp.]